MVDYFKLAVDQLTEAAKQYASRSAADPATVSRCKFCGRETIGTGWFPYCGMACKFPPRETELVQ